MNEAVAIALITAAVLIIVIVIVYFSATEDSKPPSDTQSTAGSQTLGSGWVDMAPDPSDSRSGCLLYYFSGAQPVLNSLDLIQPSNGSCRHYSEIGARKVTQVCNSTAGCVTENGVVEAQNSTRQVYKECYETLCSDRLCQILLSKSRKLALSIDKATISLASSTIVKGERSQMFSVVKSGSWARIQTASISTLGGSYSVSVETEALILSAYNSSKYEWYLLYSSEPSLYFIYDPSHKITADAKSDSLALYIDGSGNPATIAYEEAYESSLIIDLCAYDLIMSRS